MKAGNRSLALAALALCAPFAIMADGTNVPGPAPEARPAAEKEGSDRAKAVFARIQTLLREKKHSEAEKLLRELLLDDSLDPKPRRQALKQLASQIVWGSPREAKQLLEQAQTIPPSSIHDKVEAQICMGHVFALLGRPEHALEVWLPILDWRDAHPARRSEAAHQIGLTCRSKGDLEGARKYFRLAVEHGRKVQYKFDYGASEKALAELDGKN